MYNFDFNYLSRGQLVSSNLDKIFLPLLKILPCYEAFFGNLIFAIIARMLCGNHLNHNQNPFLQSFLLFLLVWRVLQKFLKGKSDAVRVAHLHSAAHFQVRVGVKS